MLICFLTTLMVGHVGWSRTTALLNEVDNSLRGGGVGSTLILNVRKTSPPLQTIYIGVWTADDSDRDRVTYSHCHVCLMTRVTVRQDDPSCGIVDQLQLAVYWGSTMYKKKRKNIPREAKQRLLGWRDSGQQVEWAKPGSYINIDIVLTSFPNAAMLFI